MMGNPCSQKVGRAGGGKDHSVVMIQDEYLLSVPDRPTGVHGKMLCVKFPAVSPSAATEGFALKYRFRMFF